MNKLFQRFVTLVFGLVVIFQPVQAIAQSLPFQTGSTWSGAEIMTIEKRPQFSSCILGPGVKITNFLGTGIGATMCPVLGYNFSASQFTGGAAFGGDILIGLGKLLHFKYNAAQISTFEGGAYLYTPKGKLEPALTAGITFHF